MTIRCYTCKHTQEHPPRQIEYTDGVLDTDWFERVECEGCGESHTLAFWIKLPCELSYYLHNHTTVPFSQPQV
jgi:hypothetical protein